MVITKAKVIHLNGADLTAILEAKSVISRISKEMSQLKAPILYTADGESEATFDVVDHAVYVLTMLEQTNLIGNIE